MRWIAVARLAPVPRAPRRLMEVRGADKCGVGTAAGKRRGGQEKNGNWFSARFTHVGAKKKYV